MGFEMKTFFFLMGTAALVGAFFLERHESKADSDSAGGTITVNIRYTGKEGAARQFAEEMTRSGTVGAIRAEKGNLRYEYYQSLEDPNTILLVDSWTDQKAIDMHHASEMMKTIARLREKYDLRMTVERYTGVKTPASEEAFIRK